MGSVWGAGGWAKAGRKAKSMVEVSLGDFRWRAVLKWRRSLGLGASGDGRVSLVEADVY